MEMVMANNDRPYKVIHWQDKSISGAKGWIVIDKLINGVAGGGLFMSPEATLEEVKDLAKTMTYKNSLNTPRFGGAKGGICFDPKSNDANSVLKHFLVDNKEIIEKLWSTGADLNTDNDLINHIVTSDLGLDSPFHCLGKMVSHYYDIPNQSEKFLSRINTPVSEFFSLGNAITGYSIVQCIRKLVRNGNNRFLIQGFGKVGSSLSYFIEAQKLGKVIGICEASGFILQKEGINVFELLELKSEYDSLDEKHLSFLHWIKEKKLKPYPVTLYEDKSSLLHEFLNRTEADIFCPCATRYEISSEIADCIINKYNGKDPNFYIISGANNVFCNKDIIHKLLNNDIGIIPEWLTNCGNSFLFTEILKLTEKEKNLHKFIFKKLDNNINRFFNILALNSSDSNLAQLYENYFKTVEKISTSTQIRRVSFFHKQRKQLMRKTRPMVANEIRPTPKSG